MQRGARNTTMNIEQCGEGIRRSLTLLPCECSRRLHGISNSSGTVSHHLIQSLHWQKHRIDQILPRRFFVEVQGAVKPCSLNNDNLNTNYRFWDAAAAMDQTVDKTIKLSRYSFSCDRHGILHILIIHLRASVMPKM